MLVYAFFGLEVFISGFILSFNTSPFEIVPYGEKNTFTLILESRAIKGVGYLKARSRETKLWPDRAKE